MVTVVNNLEAWHGMVALGIILLGYPIHELLHVIPLWIAGEDYQVNVYPRAFFSFGRFVEIEVLSDVDSRTLLAAAMAPGVLSFPSVGIYGWLVCSCSGPVLASDLLVVGAWFVIFLPSPVDWRQAYEALA